MNTNNNCELLGAAGVLWGLFVGTLLGTMMRLRYDEAVYKTNNIVEDNGTNEDEIDSLHCELYEKDEEIKQLTKQRDVLQCDEMANERLIQKLKSEYTNLTTELSNTLQRTAFHATHTSVPPPPIHIRKRHRTLSNESDISDHKPYYGSYFESYTWNLPTTETLDKETQAKQE